MRFATRREIEYLNSIDGNAADADIIDEMSRRLDALRRYDQRFSDADWHPRHATTGSRSTNNKSKS